MCSCSIRILHLTHPINFKPLILSCYFPGGKLRELLLEEGSVEMVNLRIEREHLQESQEDLQGGWHTEGSLKFIPGWDVHLDWILSKYRSIDVNCFSYISYHPLRTMVGNAIEWAKMNGCCRVNPVHGAEEYRVSTFEAFSHREINRTRSTASAEVELQDN